MGVDCRRDVRGWGSKLKAYGITSGQSSVGTGPDQALSFNEVLKTCRWHLAGDTAACSIGDTCLMVAAGYHPSRRLLAVCHNYSSETISPWQ